jgi:acyl carrier protein
MEIKEQVRAFVTSNFYLADPAALEDEASLLDRGIIDSTGVLEVIAFIEDTFGISVEDSEMLPESRFQADRKFRRPQERLRSAGAIAATRKALVLRAARTKRYARWRGRDESGFEGC